MMKFIRNINFFQGIQNCCANLAISSVNLIQFKFISTIIDQNKIVSFRYFSSSNILLKNKSRKLIATSSQNKDTPKEFSAVDEETLKLLLEDLGDDLHGVSFMAVLQPWVKWGRQKKKSTSSSLLLDEACSLVHSLPRVRVIYKEVVPLLSLCKARVFGSGSLERLIQEVRVSQAQALFVSIDHLSRVQKNELESAFGIPVFDRFFIVLSIFKHYAKSYEAKLQVSLAEMPLMSKKSLSDNEKLIIDRRETLLKSAVKRLSERKERVRQARAKSSLTSVAVVGYTNCGKTTLIRTLTGDQNIQGEDRLFATLDVTAHQASLPSGLKILLLDTVGFIRDIPTSLVASFQATLQDAAHADVVLFVRDISHPDIHDQTSTVYETLQALPLPPDTPVIVVNNKADLLSPSNKNQLLDKGSVEGMFASAITGEGLHDVLNHLEREILKVTGRKVYRMKLPTGSPKIEWLKKNTSVLQDHYDPKDPQITLVFVALNEAEKAAFRRAFS